VDFLEQHHRGRLAHGNVTTHTRVQLITLTPYKQAKNPKSKTRREPNQRASLSHPSLNCAITAKPPSPTTILRRKPRSICHPKTGGGGPPKFDITSTICLFLALILLLFYVPTTALNVPMRHMCLRHLCHF
jgi:hypothetical protein